MGGGLGGGSVPKRPHGVLLGYIIAKVAEISRSSHLKTINLGMTCTHSLELMMTA